MRVVSVIFALLFFPIVGTAQTPAQPAAPATAKPAAPATAKPAAQAPARAQAANVEANLIQVMRGILFPNSNIIFDAQNEDPAAPKKDGAEAKYGNVYGGWLAVENAALALSESANLLIIPGRLCDNGKPVPMNRPDWPTFVAGLREAGQVAYKAAQSKNQDNIVDAAGVVTEACSACHDVYREKPNLANRCTP